MTPAGFWGLNTAIGVVGGVLAHMALSRPLNRLLQDRLG